MFTSLPHTLKKYGLEADARTLFELYECMTAGLIVTLGDLFSIGQLVIVKNKRQIAPYTLAFYNYFLGIDTKNVHTLNEAVENSISYNTWLNNFLGQTGKTKIDFDASELVDKFLNDVLRKSSAEEIARRFSGEDLLKNDNPDEPDSGSSQGTPFKDTLADYRNISLDALLERMERIAKQQRFSHSGGSHWIGTDGISPYGYSGRGIGGIRIGGQSAGKSARKVLTDPSFYPVNIYRALSDNNVDAALASLKGVEDQFVDLEIDIDKTIDEGARNGGLFIPYLKKIPRKSIQVVLLMDNGGESMRHYSEAVSVLFHKMKTRFTHDIKFFYFHNSIYDWVYSDEKRRKKSIVPFERLLKLDPRHRVFIVGDAYMAPEELLSPYGAIERREECPRESIKYIQDLAKKFKKIVWLNPQDRQNWFVFTARHIMPIIKMFPLTPYGIEKAVSYVNQRK